jgi:hypothetical protein
MNMSPKDMDFLEAKHTAAREIALALGVPPMLLAIPGDNTFANYQEANRTFWRQIVLPLVARTCEALSSCLSPGFGEPLTLRADTDSIEALSIEREALWTRLEKATFLTDDEKRAAVGYGPKPQENALTLFSPNQPRDDHGRWTNSNGSAPQNTSDRNPGIIELQNEGKDGKHAIDEHVGKSDEYLLNRIQSSRIHGLFVAAGLQAAGTFPSLDAANKLVSSTLADSETEIAKYLASNRNSPLAIDKYFASPTGREAYANSGRSAPYMRDTTGVRAVIRRDPSTSRGYSIVTAFPVNP